MSRPVTLLTAVGLVLLGVVVGAVLDALVLPSVRLAMSRRQRAEILTARRRDPKQWQQDSIRMAQWEARARAEPFRSPREVRRVQANGSCAISFEIRDTMWKRMPILHVKAWDRLDPGTIVSEGWAFHEPGFTPGDTATVVLPNVYCGDLLVAGYGASALAPPPPPQLDVR